MFNVSAFYAGGAEAEVAEGYK